jgi:hypothetical protein
MGRHREHDDARRSNHASGFDQGRDVVLDVLDHFSEDNRVEARVGKRQGSGVRSDDWPANALGQEAANRRRDVRAHDLEPPVLEEPGERSLARADVEHPRPGRCREKELQEQPLAQVVARADEVGRGSPLVRQR